MNVQILDQKSGPLATYISVTCGNKAGTISIYSHGVQIVIHNASHKVWGKYGKLFRNKEEALDHFKSPEGKAIVELAFNHKTS